MNNTFHFSISAHFKKDYDVAKLEKIWGVKARKLTYIKDSISPVPSAKFLYSTKSFEAIYTDELFEEFVEAIYNKAPNIKEEIESNNGILTFCIIFTDLKDKPCLYMSNKTLTLLSKMGANFDVDII